MTELFIRNTLDVDAPVSTLWKILTDNKFIQQYMFGCIPKRTGSPARLCYGRALPTASST